MIVNIVKYISSICVVVILGVQGKTSKSTCSKYHNQYGADYGTTWIFFPDGNGVPHFVNLTANGDQMENKLSLRNEYNTEVEYRLYKSGNVENYTVLNKYGVPILKDCGVLTLNDKPIKFLTHGWKSSADKFAVEDIKNAYLEMQDVYVITADWSHTAESLFYYWVAMETKSIGMQIGSFLNSIYDRYNVSGDKLHLIGHSLGAHVMGVAASYSSFKVDRITGLDPARPLFEYPSTEESYKLDYSDAMYVDVIHTCGGVLGVESQIGVADFYPNNGTPPQPGCESIQKIIEACSHGRSFIYFAESIRYPKAFPAYKCETWEEFSVKGCPQFGYMGDNVNRNLTGKFFTKTRHKSPFGRRT